MDPKYSAVKGLHCNDNVFNQLVYTLAMVGQDNLDELLLDSCNILPSYQTYDHRLDNMTLLPPEKKIA